MINTWMATFNGNMATVLEILYFDIVPSPCYYLGLPSVKQGKRALYGYQRNTSERYYIG